MLNSPDELLGSIIDAIDTRDKQLAQSEIYEEIHGFILAVSEVVISILSLLTHYRILRIQFPDFRSPSP